MNESSTPSIYVSQHHRFPNSAASPLSPQYPPHSPASPMAIPNSTQDTQVPPPLPPPQHFDPEEFSSAGGQQKEWQLFNKDYVNQHWTDFSKAGLVKPGSSLLGGKRSSSGPDGEEDAQNEIDPARRGSSISTVTPAHRESEAMDAMASSSSEKDDGSSRSSNHRYVIFSYLLAPCPL